MLVLNCKEVHTVENCDKYYAANANLVLRNKHLRAKAHFSGMSIHALRLSAFYVLSFKKFGFFVILMGNTQLLKNNSNEADESVD